MIGGDRQLGITRDNNQNRVARLIFRVRRLKTVNEYRPGFKPAATGWGHCSRLIAAVRYRDCTAMLMNIIYLCVENLLQNATRSDMLMVFQRLGCVNVDAEAWRRLACPAWLTCRRTSFSALSSLPETVQAVAPALPQAPAAHPVSLLRYP